MKNYVKTLIYAVLSFGFFMSLFFTLMSLSPLKGIIQGVLSGVLFGMLIGIFMFFQSKKFKKIELEITNGKEIIYDGPANHFVKNEAAGGWLFLTKDELIFQSHKYNFNPHKLTIPLTEIKELKIISVSKIKKGLKVITIDGGEEVFVVNNVNEWIKLIK